MSKYLAKKTVVDGIEFDSKKEGKRYLELKDRKEKGEIKELELQKEFVLIPSFKKNDKTYRKTAYKADFYYFDNKLDKYIVEDVKSNYTRKNPIYRIKKKLFEYTYQDLELEEVI